MTIYGFCPGGAGRTVGDFGGGTAGNGEIGNLPFPAIRPVPKRGGPQDRPALTQNRNLGRAMPAPKTQCGPKARSAASSNNFAGR